LASKSLLQTFALYLARSIFVSYCTELLHSEQGVQTTSSYTLEATASFVAEAILRYIGSCDGDNVRIQVANRRDGYRQCHSKHFSDSGEHDTIPPVLVYAHAAVQGGASINDIARDRAQHLFPRVVPILKALGEGTSGVGQHRYFQRRYSKGIDRG
jgi:hypothetical protein